MFIFEVLCLCVCVCVCVRVSEWVCRGYEVFIFEVLADVDVCYDRNVHGRCVMKDIPYLSSRKFSVSFIQHDTSATTATCTAGPPLRTHAAVAPALPGPQQCLRF